MGEHKQQKKRFSFTELLIRFRNSLKPGPLDSSLLIIIFMLLIFGLIMVYSASSYEANKDFGDAMYYLKKQAQASVVGFILMLAVGKIAHMGWIKNEKINVLIAVIAIALMFLLFVPGIKHTVNGATRWIKIGPIQFQPVEIVKLATITAQAYYIWKNMDKLHYWKVFLLGLSYPIIGFVAAYGISRNLSSAIIVFLMGAIMIFVASIDYKKYVILLLGVVLFATVLVLMVSKIDLSAGNASFRFARIQAWLHPEEFRSGTGYQTLQALYAIGSGGVKGKGLGQSVQKMDFIPEAQNDMVFSIICEELGLVGAFVTLGLFILLLGRIYLIARETKDLFSYMIVIGVFSHIALQVILNIAVVTNSIPNTGISLPLISYGGTSALFLMIELGLVLAVNRENVFESQMARIKRRRREREE